MAFCFVEQHYVKQPTRRTRHNRSAALRKFPIAIQERARHQSRSETSSWPASELHRSFLGFSERHPLTSALCRFDFTRRQAWRNRRRRFFASTVPVRKTAISYSGLTFSGLSFAGPRNRPQRRKMPCRCSLLCVFRTSTAGGSRNEPTCGSATDCSRAFPIRGQDCWRVARSRRHVKRACRSTVQRQVSRIAALPCLSDRSVQRQVAASIFVRIDYFGFVGDTSRHAAQAKGDTSK